MNHALSRSPALPVASPDACLDAFQSEVDYVLQSLRRLGTAPSEIEDLAQEVFLVLRRSWIAYDPARPLRPYLFGIAFRISSTYERKRKRQVTFELVEVGDTNPGPLEALQAKQARALVRLALERIPLSRRAVLTMHDLDDVPVGEVAAALAIPLFTVYSRLRKARQELESSIRRLLRAPDQRTAHR